MTFTNYYASTANHSIDKLQIVIEGSTDYDANSSDPTLDQKIETFDFDGLVTAFDTARAGNPSLTSWSLTNALAAQYLTGSDSAALGGDLAYRYGLNGNLSDISFVPAIGDTEFRRLRRECSNPAACWELTGQFAAAELIRRGTKLRLQDPSNEFAIDVRQPPEGAGSALGLPQFRRTSRRRRVRIRPHDAEAGERVGSMLADVRWGCREARPHATHS
jgi:hypothetical protein